MTTTQAETTQAIEQAPVPLIKWLKPEFIHRCFERHEKGDAELFAEMYSGKYAYDHAHEHWYVYDGFSWHVDETGSVIECVTDGVAAQYFYLAAIMRKQGKESAGEIAGRASGLRFKNSINNVLYLAARERKIALGGNEWDKNPMLFGVANGTLALKTGSLLHANPRDYIKSASSVEWCGIKSAAPRWELFLKEIFAGDEVLISFVQRLLGYGLTGLCSEHMFPVLWGEGRNGKDTLLETIKFVVGDMATPVSAEVMLDGGRNPNAATPHLAALRGKRLVWVDETNEGAKLNTGQVKMLTGGGTIVARPLHSKPITFSPQYLLMLVTNHQPHADSDDYALWKRMVLIKFTESFVDNPVEPNEHKRDPNLGDKLRAEAHGVLAWMMRGCLEWRKHGLQIPNSVRLATEEYQDGEDTTAMFLVENCEQRPGVEIGATELYKNYMGWCKSYSLKPMSMSAFGRRLSKRFKKERKTSGFTYSGITVKQDEPILLT